MKSDIFCSWGDGPDVGINYKRTDEEAKAWGSECTQWFVDLTAKEAREMAAKLIACAEEAEAIERDAAAYDAAREKA